MIRLFAGRLADTFSSANYWINWINWIKWIKWITRTDKKNEPSLSSFYDSFTISIFPSFYEFSHSNT